MASGSWLLTTGGVWNNDANWTAAFPNALTDTATFATDITADATIAMNQALSVGSMTFSDNGDSGNAWTIAPGGAFALTLGTSTITTTTNATISAAVAGTAAITKAGAGTLTLSGGGTNTGAWAVNAGTLAVTTAALTATTGTITVNSGGTLTSTANISKPIVVNSGGTGTFNADTGTVAVYGTVTLNNGTTTAAGSVFGAVGATALLTVAGTRNITRSGSGAYLDFNATTGKLAIYQSGGTISNTGSAVSVLGFGNNGSSSSAPYTYYKGTGGTLNSNRYFLISWPAGDATSGTPTVFDIEGATVTCGFTFYAGQNDCIINVTSGSVTTNASAAASLLIGGPATPAGTARVLTIDGSSASAAFTAGTNTTFQLCGAQGTDTLNIIQDGVFSCINATFTTNSTKQVALWGGKLITTGTFGAASGGAMTFRLFDRPGYANKISASTGSGVLAQNIAEPTGYGVSALAYTQGAGYIGPPIIKITGGSGSGATARAVWASDGTISSIIVTNPGSGYLAGDVLSFTASNGLPISGGTAITPGAVTLAANTTNVGFTKQDSGTLALSGTNTFTGSVTVSQGTLRIGNAGTTGTLGLNDTSSAVVASGATLAFGRSDARTYSSLISGDGTIAVNGGARATISGVNTFTSASAAIALSTTNSVLRVTNGNSIGQGTSFGITVAANTALEIDGTSGNITTLPAKALTLNGTGVSTTGALLNVAGSNTYSGTITLASASGIGSTSGTLSLTSASAITGSSTNLSFYGAGDVDLTSAVNTGPGNITKVSGTGAAILRGTSTYTGTTAANAGYLGYTTNIVASTNGSFGNATSSITVAENAGLRYYGSGSSTFSRGLAFSGATAGGTYKLESNGAGAVTHSAAPTYATTNIIKTLQLGGTGTASNTISYIVANNGTGAVSITKADAGTWALSNTGNSYTGATTVNGGTLQLSIASWVANAKVTSTSTVTVNAGGRIQTLKGTGANAQNGRHTYTNLTFAANSRIRIGG